MRTRPGANPHSERAAGTYGYRLRVLCGRTTVESERESTMFPKGRISQTMIGVLFTMTGVLIGLALQPSGLTLRTAHVLVAVIFGCTAILAMDRHSQDEFDRGVAKYAP